MRTEENIGGESRKTQRKTNQKRKNRKKDSEIQEKYNENTMRDPTINRKKMGPAGKNTP